MGTVTIGSATHTIYGTSAGADDYLAATTAWATAWAAATATAKSRALVSATRELNATRWQGTRAVAGQALAWPRVDVVDGDGEDVDESTIPQDVIDAAYLLAAMYLDNAARADESPDTAANIKRAKAGSVEVEYHQRIASDPFPRSVLLLVEPYMTSGASRAGGIGGYSTGTDVVPRHEIDYTIGGIASDLIDTSAEE